MQVQQLRYFICLVDKHSFTEAAKECFITQPALSMQIKSLEKELDVTLINRIGRKFEVTPAGKLLYERAGHIIEEIEELTERVQRVNRNLGSTFRLGLLSSMDKDKMPERLKELMLNRTGMELSIIYGSHDELYEQFGNGCINAFVSDGQRLMGSESFSSIKLFSSKMYAEISHTTDIPHFGVSKLKLDVEQLNNLKLFTVCEKEHLLDEQFALMQMLHLQNEVQIEAVSTIAEGRKLILQQPNSALIIDRSLLRGDYQGSTKTFRYELIYQNKAVKKPLCLYARKNISLNELKEMCTILNEMGSKRGRIYHSDDLFERSLSNSRIASDDITPKVLSYTGHQIPL